MIAYSTTLGIVLSGVVDPSIYHIDGILGLNCDVKNKVEKIKQFKSVNEFIENQARPTKFSEVKERENGIRLLLNTKNPVSQGSNVKFKSEKILHWLKKRLRRYRSFKVKYKAVVEDHKLVSFINGLVVKKGNVKVKKKINMMIDHNEVIRLTWVISADTNRYEVTIMELEPPATKMKISGHIYTEVLNEALVKMINACPKNLKLKLLA